MPRSLSVEVIATRIYMIRGQRVMLDKDLAKLYGVSVKRLNEQVKRNIKRFPQDFMFLLMRQTFEVQDVMDLESEHIASKQGQNIKYLPYAFTEQGVAMLSSVLNSERPIQVNIMIMRAFVKLKELLLTHKDLAEKIAALEKKYATHDDHIQLIFEAIKKLLEPVPPQPELPESKKPLIGFSKD